MMTAGRWLPYLLWRHTVTLEPSHIPNTGRFLEIIWCQIQRLSTCYVQMAVMVKEHARVMVRLKFKYSTGRAVMVNLNLLPGRAN